MSTIEWTFIIAGGIVLFVIWWCMVVYLLSFLAGWRGLAVMYGQASPAGGKIFSFQAGKVGIVSYNGALRLAVSPPGIGFSVIRVFRPGHAPFFIPWAEIEITGKSFWGMVKFRTYRSGSTIQLTKQFFVQAWDSLPSGIKEALQEKCGITRN